MLNLIISVLTLILVLMTLGIATYEIIDLVRTNKRRKEAEKELDKAREELEKSFKALMKSLEEQCEEHLKEEK